MAKGTWKLQLRLIIAMILLFIIFFIISLMGLMFFGDPGDYISAVILSILLMLVEYLFSPWAVERLMHMIPLRYEDAPQIYEMVEDLCNKAEIPMPKISISPSSVPNACAYGRGIRDGRICVTKGIVDILTYKELKAVLGHEIAHIKHRDMAVMTIAQFVPTVCLMVIHTFYRIVREQNREDRHDETGLSMLYIFLIEVSIVLFFISELLVLFISRVREYYADEASMEFGNPPEYLISSLYKMSYGTSLCSELEINTVDGMKAFFSTDVTKASKDINELYQIDFNKDGKIDRDEVIRLKNTKVKIGFWNTIMELISTHPDTLKRVKKMSEYEE